MQCFSITTNVSKDEGVKEMNDSLKKVLVAKYNAEIEDAKYKIKCYSDHCSILSCI